MDGSLSQPATKADLLALEQRMRSLIDGKLIAAKREMDAEVRRAIQVAWENRQHADDTGGG